MTSVEARALDAVSTLDWEHLSADTQYLTHSIHRYSGKFIPQIAAQAIELLTEPGDLVVDPYCGSGTVLLEAALRGRRSVGVDLNPVAVLITRVKTHAVGRDRLQQLQQDLTREVASLEGGQLVLGDVFGSGSARSDTESDPRWDDPWFRKWFADERRFELIAIAHAIERCTDADLRGVALVAFSDVLRRASNANTSYPNVMFDARKSTPRPVARRFLERLTTVIDRVGKLEEALAEESEPLVVRGDAVALPMRDSCADAVVTHPPYIGSVPYAEYGLLSLKWLGYEPKEIDLRLTGGRRQSKDVVERFSIAFAAMLRETSRVLKQGGHLFMLLGCPQVRGERIDLPAMALQHGADAGLQVVSEYHRRGGNRRANLMDEERLLFFRRTDA